MQIAVGGCLAQKDRDLIQQRAPWVDAVFGTHNVGHAAELLHRAAAPGPVMEILEAAQPTTTTRSPRPCRSAASLAHGAWVTIQIGCDNNCAFCIVPSVRGAEISRPFGQIVAEVEQLAAAGTRRGHPARPERQLLRARHHHLAAPRPGLGAGASDRAGAAWTAPTGPGPGRCSPTCCGPSPRVDGIRRVRYTSPHPKDLRPETIEAMADEPAVCEHLHLPLQSGSDRTLAAMHRGYTAERYLERLAAARAAIDDLAVTTDIIVGFPGETEDDFERTLEVVAEAGYDSAYTFIYSPRPGTEAAARTERVRARRRGRRALRAAPGRRRALGPGPAPGPGRPGRGGAGRGPVQAGPGGDQRADPPEQAGPLPAPGRLPGRDVRRGADHPGRPPLPGGELVEVTARPRAHEPASRCVGER